MANDEAGSFDPLAKWSTEWQPILQGASQRWREDDEAQRLFELNYRWMTEHAEGRAAHSVLVPLCGDSRVVPYMWEQGLRVVGVEIFPTAVERLLEHFKDKLTFTRTELDNGSVTMVSSDGKVLVYQGDFFDFVAWNTEQFDVVYDRGALTAIEPFQRLRYADGEIAALRRPNGMMLLDCFDRSTHPHLDDGKVPYTTSPEDMERLYIGASRPLRVLATDRRDATRFTQQRFLMTFKE